MVSVNIYVLRRIGKQMRETSVGAPSQIMPGVQNLIAESHTSLELDSVGIRWIEIDGKNVAGIEIEVIYPTTLSYCPSWEVTLADRITAFLLETTFLDGIDRFSILTEVRQRLAGSRIMRIR